MFSPRRCSPWFRAAHLAAALPLLLTFACDAPSEPEHSGPPNVIMILADDQGYGDFGFMGSQHVQTPNIDALAEGGTVFPVTYNSASVCRPAQISLLTGLEPTQWEATLRSQRELGPEHRGLDRIRRFATLPRVLGTFGYETLQAGKLWEGTYDMAGFSAGSKTSYQVGLGQKLAAWSGGPSAHAEGRSTMRSVHRFIDESAHRPFYIWFAPLLPHIPFNAPEQYTRLYEGLGLSEHEKQYFANVTRLDAVVGELLAHLQSRGIRDRTLVIYLSDNGWETDDDENVDLIATGGERGKKSMYELGWRTPMIFNWPGHIPGGRMEPAIASSLDLFQTILDYAGIEPFADRPGKSLRPILEGRASHVREALIGSDAERGFGFGSAGEDGVETSGPNFFLRDDTWHYIWGGADGREELYAIADDPEERVDIAAAHPALTQSFRQRIEAWHSRIDQPAMPIPPLRRQRPAPHSPASGAPLGAAGPARE